MSWINEIEQPVLRIYVRSHVHYECIALCERTLNGVYEYVCCVYGRMFMNACVSFSPSNQLWHNVWMQWLAVAVATTAAHKHTRSQHLLSHPFSLILLVHLSPLHPYPSIVFHRISVHKPIRVCEWNTHQFESAVHIVRIALVFSCVQSIFFFF